jgi:methylated-DNA-[protein]-cysteine S-methyltransferase
VHEVTFVAERTMSSPLGDLVLRASDTGVRRIAFVGEVDRRVWKRVPPEGEDQAERILDDAVVQLDDYFAGRRRTFDLPLEPLGTEFQLSVWWALARIPYAETVSYAVQATWVGRPTATRAVGGANGRNPLPIVLPCHRVIGADGSLTGYGGGIERKVWLLHLEGARQASRVENDSHSR